jgi:hypothetical protein
MPPGLYEAIAFSAIADRFVSVNRHTANHNVDGQFVMGHLVIVRPR